MRMGLFAVPMLDEPSDLACPSTDPCCSFFRLAYKFCVKGSLYWQCSNNSSAACSNSVKAMCIDVRLSHVSAMCQPLPALPTSDMPALIIVSVCSYPVHHVSDFMTCSSCMICQELCKSLLALCQLNHYCNTYVISILALRFKTLLAHHCLS